MAGRGGKTPCQASGPALSGRPPTNIALPLGWWAPRTSKRQDEEAKNDVFPGLSESSKILLIEASKDSRGEIMRVTSKDGLTIQTNGKQFVNEQLPKTVAEWEAVLEDLKTLDLIKEKRSGPYHTFYNVSLKGYEIIGC